MSYLHNEENDMIPPDIAWGQLSNDELMYLYKKIDALVQERKDGRFKELITQICIGLNTLHEEFPKASFYVRTSNTPSYIDILSKVNEPFDANMFSLRKD